MDTSEGFPIFTIQGPPRQRGRQYGRQAAKYIRTTLKLYLGRFAGEDAAAREQVHLRAREFGTLIGERYPEAYEEMIGIAEGVDCTVEEVVAINARTEILFGRQPTDGCTGAVVLPERGGDRTIMGQNWDWWSASSDCAVILRIIPEKGPRILTFVEAGMLARSGMNSAGLGLCGNFLQSDRDFRADGIPIPVIRRAILASDTLPRAVGEVLRSPRAFSSNHLIGDKGGEAIDLEATPGEVFPVFAEGGMLVHANHFNSVAARSKLVDVGIAKFPDSLFRERRVRAQLAAAPAPLGREALIAALSDHFGYPDAVCRHPAPRPDGTIVETVGSVVMELDAGRMWVAKGRPCCGKYRQVLLDEGASEAALDTAAE
jgi:isopenicillin-N N-acyltransferase-like protein